MRLPATVVAIISGMNEEPQATLRDELAAVAKRRGLRKLAGNVTGQYGARHNADDPRRRRSAPHQGP